MKKNFLVPAIICIIAIVAVITNPNQDRHKEVIKNKFNSYLQKSVKESLAKTNSEWEQAGQALGMMLGGALSDRIIDTTISADNFVLFSTTKMTWNGQTTIIGIGVFGNVFFTQKLDDALKEGLLNQQ